MPAAGYFQRGTTAIGDNFFETIHTYGRGAALQITDHAAIGAHDNEFTAGATADYAR